LVVLAKWVIRECGYDEEITFADIRWSLGVALAVSVTDESSWEPRLLTHEDSPDVPAYLAVAASMAVQFVFSPVSVNGSLCSDGGLALNFPIDHFARRAPYEVIGVRMRRDRPVGKAGWFVGRAARLLGVARGVANQLHIPTDLWKRTIRVDPPPFSFLDFDAMSKNLPACMELGREAVSRWEEGDVSDGY